MLIIHGWEMKTEGELICSPSVFFWMVTLLGVGISTDRFDSYCLNVDLFRLIGAHVPH
jgi:hypothetical protein